MFSPAYAGDAVYVQAVNVFLARQPIEAHRKQINLIT